MFERIRGRLGVLGVTLTMAAIATVSVATPAAAFTWGTWTKIPGTYAVVSEPAALSWNKRFWVFGVTETGRIVQASKGAGTPWSVWKAVRAKDGHEFVGVGATIYQKKPLLIANDIDARIWWTQRVDGAWTEWTEVGGATYTRPSAIAYQGELSVAVNGTDFSIQNNRLDGADWSGWGWVIADGYTLGVSQPNQVILDGALIVMSVDTAHGDIISSRRSGTDGFSDWDHSGIKPDAAISATAVDGSVLIARKTNDGYSTRTWDGDATWSEWSALPTTTGISVPAVVVHAGHPWVLATDADGKIRRIRG